jgi:rare lipoprotein A
MTRLRITGLFIMVTLFTGACSTSPYRDSAPKGEVNVAGIPDAVPRDEPITRAGNPPKYTVLGQTYYVKQSSDNHIERGIASWYGTKFHGRKTSNGEIYDMYKMTAAHKTLPIPTYVEVTNLKNGRSVVVRVNDRGPFHENRIIDLSYVAAKKLGIAANGTGLVEVRSIDPNNWQAKPNSRYARNYRTASSSVAKTRQPATDTGQDAALFIQAGAFASQHNAKQLQQKLNELLPDSSVKLAFAEQDRLYRVRIGPIPSVSEADRVARTISENGYPAPQVVID